MSLQKRPLLNGAASILLAEKVTVARIEHCPDELDDKTYHVRDVKYFTKYSSDILVPYNNKAGHADFCVARLRYNEDVALLLQCFVAKRGDVFAGALDGDRFLLALGNWSNCFSR